MNGTILFSQKCQESGKLSSVNLLKALAILMVLFVHTGQLFKNWPLYDVCKLGQLGCQCFFVMSGFTLSLSWNKGNHKWSDFFKKRFKAIAPGYYFAILLYCLCTLLVSVSPLPLYWQQDLSFVGWLSNVTFTHGLFPNHINRVVPGGWYIGTTALLYLLFPLLKKMVDHLCQTQKPIFYIVLICLFLLPLSIWIFLHSIDTDIELKNNSFLYFFVVNQMPCFLIGILLHKIYQGGVNVRLSVIYIIMATSFILTLFLFYTPFYWAFSLVPITSSFFFASILVLLTAKGKTNTAFANAISQVSYEMYLVHSLFIYFFLYWVIKAIKHFHYDVILSSVCFPLLCYVVIVTVSFLTARLIHTFIQNITKHIQ